MTLIIIIRHCRWDKFRSSGGACQQGAHMAQIEIAGAIQALRIRHRLKGEGKNV
jgi:hypothetical protein